MTNPAFPNAPKHSAAARTLDAVARKSPAAQSRAPLPMQPPSNDEPRKRMWPHVRWEFHAAFVVVTGLALLAAYANSFGPKNRPQAAVNWTLDNKYIIELDPRTKVDAHVFQPSTWLDTVGGKPDFVDIWTRDYWWPKGISGLYRPVVTFTYWLNWRKMSGDETKLDASLSPAQREAAVEEIVKDRLLIFHIVNYWAHFLTTVLVYLLALHLTQRFWIAAAIGLLFGLHPVAVESVTNIIGRADIFASINVIGGLLLYIRATMSRGMWKVPWLVALGLLTTIGVFSKESAIAVIAALALYDSIYRVPWRRLFWFPHPVVVDCVKVGLRLALALALGLSFVSVVIRGMLPMMSDWFTPVAATAAPGTAPMMQWRWTLMLIFAGLSFISLVTLMAILPFGRQRFWWIIGLVAPFAFVLHLMVSESYRSAMAWVFLIASAALVLLELLWPAESELRESNSAESFEPLSANSLDNPWRWLSAPYFVFIPILFALMAVRGAVFDAATPPETPYLDNPIRGVNWFGGEITALQVLARLWWILLFPKDLCCDYSFNQVPTFGYLSTPFNDTLGLLAALLVIGVFAYAIYLWTRNKAASFFILFFFVAFLPTSNLLITIGSIMAERFLYLPLVGFVGAFVLGLEWIITRVGSTMNSGEFVPLASRAGAAPSTTTPGRRAFAPGSPWPLLAVVGVIAIAYGIRTFFRNYAWQSDYTLWHAAKDVSPKSFRSYQSYAFALFEELQKPVAKRQPETKNVTIDDCITWIAKGRPIVDVLPDRFNSSRLYLHQGMYTGVKAEGLCIRNADGTTVTTPEAAEWFKKSIEALEIGRRVDRAFNEINRQKEIQRGKRVEAIPDAGLLQVYEYLGLSYFRLGMFDQALDNYLYMRRLDPQNADSYEKIAMLFLQTNRHEDCAITMIQTLWLDGNRKHLWPVLEQKLIMLSREQIPPVQIGPDRQPKLNMSSPVVQSTLCSAYQRFCRIFLESKQFDLARMVRIMGVRDLGFPQGLFDDIFREFDVDPGPLPPRPAQQPPPNALPATQPVPKPVPKP